MNLNAEYGLRVSKKLFRRFVLVELELYVHIRLVFQTQKYYGQTKHGLSEYHQGFCLQKIIK